MTAAAPMRRAWVRRRYAAGLAMLAGALLGGLGLVAAPAAYGSAPVSTADLSMKPAP